MRPLATRCTLQRNLPALTTASGTGGSLGKLQTVKSGVSSYHTQQWIGYRLIFPLQLVEPGTQLQSPATWTTWTTWTTWIEQLEPVLCAPPPTGITRAYLCSHPDQHQWHLCFGLVNGVDDLWRKQNWYRCKWIIRWSSSGLLFFSACFWFLLNLMLPEKEMACEFKNISPVKVPHKQRTHQVSIKYRSSISIVKWNVWKCEQIFHP